MRIVNNILNTLIVFLLLAAVASSRNGKILGIENNKIFNGTVGNLPPDSVKNILPDSHYSLPHDSILNKYRGKFRSIDEGIWQNNRGVSIIYSAPYAKNIVGYAGETPLYIFVKDSIILEISPAPNAETKIFFTDLIKAGLLNAWNNIELSKANEVKPDAISGSTLSSVAVIKTVEAVSAKIQGIEHKDETYNLSTIFSYKTILALIVLVSGLLISVYFKKKKWRTLQLVLNVLVLGFWCGQFISMSWLVGWLSSGANILLVLVPFIMLMLALIMPMFNKKSYYCTWICPFGAAQELVSKIPVKKHKLSTSVMKYLKYMREAILILILVLAWLGISFELIEYEPFSAFVFKQAGNVIIIIAVLFLVLSLFIHRPWCRFFCPTGQILDWCSEVKKKSLN